MATEIKISAADAEILKKAKAAKEKERRYWAAEKVWRTKAAAALKTAGIEITVTEAEIDEAVKNMKPKKRAA